MAFKLSDYYFGIICAIIIAVGGIFMIQSAINADPTIVTGTDLATFSAFSNQYNKTLALESKTNELKNTIQNPHLPGIFGNVETLFGQGFNFLMSIYDAFGFFSTLISDSTKDFGFIIPKWLISLVIILITGAIAFAVASAVLQRDI